VLEVRIERTLPVEIDPNTPEVISADCDSSEFVTGGGYNGHPAIIVQGNHPDIAPPKWVVTGLNTGAVPNPIQVYAVCAKLVDAP
jgi:hypothetical protein